ncbi:RepB family plasmid replication initiator protein [Neisseria meningitidis]|uniref:RepB family plasmid replication initiator protein n=1 Tax=Neisseria meningitidis TaxID=487 RepID=UPI0038791A78
MLLTLHGTDKFCIVNNFHTNRNTAYKALKDACNNLFERQFSFIEKTPKGEKVVRTRWVSQVAYIEQQATVELGRVPNLNKPKRALF